MSLEPLMEMRTSTAKVLESQEGSGVFRFEALLSEAEHINRNKRMYPRELMQRAVEEFRTSIRQRPGAVDHPDPYTPPSLSDNGILWEDVWWDGMRPNELWGRGRIIPTQKGKDLQANIEAGVEVGFSTRGRGRGEERQLSEGTFTEMIEYELDTIDAVTDPSVFHARSKTFTKENAEMAQENVAEFVKTVEGLTGRAIDAERAAADLKSQLESFESKAQADREKLVAEHTEALSAVRAQLEAVEKELSELKAAKQADEVQAHLIGLTQESTFGPAIRAEIEKMQKFGLVVTLDNAQAVVDGIRPMIEALAASGNYQAPVGEGRGDVPGNEDTNEGAGTFGSELSPAEQAELRAAGLL